MANKKHMVDRNNPILRKKARYAKAVKRIAYETHSEKVVKFLEEVEKDSQLAKTFRFIRQHKQHQVKQEEPIASVDS